MSDRPRSASATKGFPCFLPCCAGVVCPDAHLLAGVIRRHRRHVGSSWRKLNHGRQALLGAGLPAAPPDEIVVDQKQTAGQLQRYTCVESETARPGGAAAAQPSAQVSGDRHDDDPDTGGGSSELDATYVVTTLYQGHALALIRLAYVMLGDRHTAEDVVQDAFYGFYRAWHRLPDRGNLLAYLRASVVNGAARCTAGHAAFPRRWPI